MGNLSVKVLFLDRDGVINKKAAEHEYVTSVENFLFNPGIFSLAKFFLSNGYRIIIVTNQRGISRHKMTTRDLHEIHEHMLTAFKKEGIDILDIFFCPHGEGECHCRKPKPGLLEQAVAKYDINLAESVLISDSSKDVEMGLRFGIGKNVLVPADKPEQYA